MKPEFALGVAHERGLTDATTCQYEKCDAPGGPSWFDNSIPKWRASVDRIVMGMNGGEYVPENVRRMHKRCNERLVHEQPEYQARMAKVYASPEWRANTAVRDASPEYRANRAKMFASPEWSARGKKSNCTRWQINRGLPCICGQHELTA